MMTVFEVFEHVHNSRTLLTLVCRYLDSDSEPGCDEIRFAIEKAYSELCKAEEGVENLPM